MSLQEMQQFQEKHKLARADDTIGIYQPHTTSVGMHQGNVGDLPNSGGYQTFQVGYIRNN